jgi:hypothetical protein
MIQEFKERLKKLLSWLRHPILVIPLVLITFLIIKGEHTYKKFSPNIKAETLAKIPRNNLLNIDSDLFLPPKEGDPIPSIKIFEKQLMEIVGPKVQLMQQLQMAAKFGIAIPKVLLEPTVINVVINSPGGAVIIMKDIVKGVNSIKKQLNVYLNCYIIEAHSAAVNFAEESCNKITMVHGGVLGTHIGSGENSTGNLFFSQSFMYDIFYARNITNVSRDEFVKKALQNGHDIYLWSEEDALKYKLIDEVLK